VSHFDEFRNGWGSAPVVWDYLSEKYIPEKPVYSLDKAHMDKVWKLASDDRLEGDEKLVLLMTFDFSYVPRDKLTEAADACKQFAVRTSHVPGVNHWAAIGESLRKLADTKISRHARGACLSCTSVNDEWSNNKEWPLKAWSIFAEDA
jgi:hypothetical protein